jgi:hypothetical protein
MMNNAPLWIDTADTSFTYQMLPIWLNNDYLKGFYKSDLIKHCLMDNE